MPTTSDTLSARDELVVTLSIEGYSAVEVAERAGISARSVERIRSKHRALLAAPQSKPSARQVLEALLHSADERVRLAAAQTLLKVDPDEQPATRASLAPTGAVIHVHTTLPDGAPPPVRDLSLTDASRTTKAAEAASALPVTPV